MNFSKHLINDYCRAVSHKQNKYELVKRSVYRYVCMAGGERRWRFDANDVK
jgi:hypothetical protein